MLAHLTDITHHTDGSLVLGMVLGSIKSTHLKRCTGIDRRVAGGADVELSELVELDLHRVSGITFALGLGLLGLFLTVSYYVRKRPNGNYGSKTAGTASGNMTAE